MVHSTELRPRPPPQCGGGESGGQSVSSLKLNCLSEPGRAILASGPAANFGV